jgi:hypothetical protein
MPPRGGHLNTTQTMFDHAGFNAFLEEDAAYQATLKNHRELHAEVSRAETEVRGALRRVVRMMMAVDVVRQQQWKLEGVSEEQGQMLENFTTDNDETWFYQYDQAADDIEETAVAACAMVVEKRAEVKEKKIKAREHCDLLNFAREQAREAFEKQQEEAKASA